MGSNDVVELSPKQLKFLQDFLNIDKLLSQPGSGSNAPEAVVPSREERITEAREKLAEEMRRDPEAAQERYAAVAGMAMRRTTLEKIVAQTTQDLDTVPPDLDKAFGEIGTALNGLSSTDPTDQIDRTLEASDNRLAELHDVLEAYKSARADYVTALASVQRMLVSLRGHTHADDFAKQIDEQAAGAEKARTELAGAHKYNEAADAVTAIGKALGDIEQSADARTRVDLVFKDRAERVSKLKNQTAHKVLDERIKAVRTELENAKRLIKETKFQDAMVILDRFPQQCIDVNWMCVQAKAYDKLLPETAERLDTAYESFSAKLSPVKTEVAKLTGTFQRTGVEDLAKALEAKFAQAETDAKTDGARKYVEALKLLTEVEKEIGPLLAMMDKYGSAHVVRSWLDDKVKDGDFTRADAILRKISEGVAAALKLAEDHAQFGALAATTPGEDADAQALTQAAERAQKALETLLSTEPGKAVPELTAKIPDQLKSALGDIAKPDLDKARATIATILWGIGYAHAMGVQKAQVDAITAQADIAYAEVRDHKRADFDKAGLAALATQIALARQDAEQHYFSSARQQLQSALADCADQLSMLRAQVVFEEAIQPLEAHIAELDKNPARFRAVFCIDRIQRFALTGRFECASQMSPDRPAYEV